MKKKFIIVGIAILLAIVAGLVIFIIVPNNINDNTVGNDILNNINNAIVENNINTNENVIKESNKPVQQDKENTIFRKKNLVEWERLIINYYNNYSSFIPDVIITNTDENGNLDIYTYATQEEYEKNILVDHFFVDMETGYGLNDNKEIFNFEKCDQS